MQTAAQFSLLVRTVKDYAIYLFDRSGHITSWNTGAQTILGYSEKEVLGKPVSLFYTPEQLAEKLPEHILNNAISHGSFEDDGWRLKKDGSRFWANSVLTVLYNDAQEITGFAEITKDITERKRATDKIASTENRYRNTLDKMMEGIQIYDVDWNCLYANDAAISQGVYTKEEILNRTLLENYPGIEHTELFRIFLQCVYAKESKHIEYEFVFPDKSTKWFELSLQPMPEGIFILSIDISERKKAAKHILDSEEKRRLIMNASLDAIICIDTKGIVTFWNPQAEKIFGWTDNEANGRSLSEIIIPKPFRKLHEKGMEKYLETGQGPALNILLELSAINREGKEFPIELTVLPIKQGNEEFFCAFVRDISERKKADEALRNSELRFRSLIEKGSEIIALHDADGKVIYISPSIKTLLGYDPEERIGKQAFESVHPDDIHRLEKILKELLAVPGKVKRTQWRHRHANGDWHWMDGVATNLLHDRSVNAVVHNFRDITEQKEAQNKMILEKELSESIINSLPGVFYLFNEAGKYLRWNGNLESVSGYTHDEIATMHPLEFFAEDEKELVLQRIQEVFSKGLSEVEANFITRDGKAIAYYFNGRAIYFEGQRCLIGMGIDISERKKGEGQLKLLESVITNTTDSVMITEAEPIDGDGPKIIYVNDAFINISGYSQEELIGKTPRILQGPKTDRNELNKLRKALEEWKPCKIEVVNYRKNGEEFWVNISVAPVADQKGWFTHWIAIERDVTERKKAEEELKEKNTEFQRLSTYLQNVREGERKYIAREVHDELGQLASALKIDIDWMCLKIDTLEAAAQKRIQHANKSIEILITSIRKIAYRLRPSILDDFGLNAALQWHCNEFETLSDKHCVFESSINDQDLSIEVKTELFRITQESLTNVMRHSNARNAKISITEDGQNIHLSISDDGSGFDTSQRKNTLGLIGLRERAVSLNGELHIESQIGKGTTVHAVIPQK